MVVVVVAGAAGCGGSDHFQSGRSLLLHGRHYAGDVQH